MLWLAWALQRWVAGHGWATAALHRCWVDDDVLMGHTLLLTSKDGRRQPGWLWLATCHEDSAIRVGRMVMKNHWLNGHTHRQQVG